MWRTMNIAAGNLLGSPSTNFSSTLSPPAEAPTTMMSRAALFIPSAVSVIEAFV
jgi:hypothetical protein